jgi:hypothetical protein
VGPVETSVETTSTETDQHNGKKQVQQKAKLMLAPSKTGSSNKRLNKMISAIKK